MKLKKRFIAGAVCPRCSEMDKLTMYIDETGLQVRECVSCGFNDSMDNNEQPEELPTRVNQPRVGEQPLAHEDEVSIVQLIDPKADPNRKH